MKALVLQQADMSSAGQAPCGWSLSSSYTPPCLENKILAQTSVMTSSCASLQPSKLSSTSSSLLSSSSITSPLLSTYNKLLTSESPRLSFPLTTSVTKHSLLSTTVADGALVSRFAHAPSFLHDGEKKKRVDDESTEEISEVVQSCFEETSVQYSDEESWSPSKEDEEEEMEDSSSVLESESAEQEDEETLIIRQEEFPELDERNDDTIEELKDKKYILLNLVCCSLVQKSVNPGKEDWDSEYSIWTHITKLGKEISESDPEFLLKVALYTRQKLNIRITANFLLALAANLPSTKSHVRRYFCAAVQLPSDWLEVVRIYSTCFSRSLPACLKKAMVDKFKQFNEYQLAKYNTRKHRCKHNRNKGTKKKPTDMQLEEWAKAARSDSSMLKKFLQLDGVDTTASTVVDKKQSEFSMKKMIKRLHIKHPAEYVMAILGKKYPSDPKAFNHSGMKGAWDRTRAGKRMKLKEPQTWERLLSLQGNKAATWEKLIDDKSLPFMAMLRNLRNMISVGISEAHHNKILSRLTNKKAVIQSRQFPFRFLAAYKVIMELHSFASAADLIHILAKKVRRRKRGKRAGALVRLRNRGSRTPLPGIFLSNVRSLCNKMDELSLLLRRNRDFSSSCVLCFTETWLCDLIPDCALQLEGFQLFRADRHRELSGKTKGGGVSFYINSSWCSDVTVISQYCSPDLEYLFIHCKPFYSPREFASFILAAVYIPPGADVRVAQRELADQILSVEQTFPESQVIVLGDFNKGNLSHELPKYKQLIKCPTREENTLDHCYSTISSAYRAVPRAALGLSDHVMIHLIPTYRQKLKLSKPELKTSKRWTSQAVEELRFCLDTTDWDVFRDAAGSLDEYTDTVTSYIQFCENSIIPTCTRVSYNNDKPWFTAKLKQLRSEKEAAFKSGNRENYKQAKYRFRKEIRSAKSMYSEKLKQQFSANDSASVWRGLRQITNYKPKASHSTDDLQLANNLNEFYCRFDKQPAIPDTPQQPNNPPFHISENNSHRSALSPSSSPTGTLCITKEEVNRQFRKLNPRKASGPDGVSPATLRHCAEELTPVFTGIFNTSLQSCHVPACLKSSTIVPVPKKTRITGLNDYRPVALTSAVMKSFERLVLHHLKSITAPLLDPLQFAYRANRSVDDAINLALHHILQHLDSPGTYARILFVDFSSAFNTVSPALLQDKLSQLNVPAPTCQWITSFLTDRTQHVRLGKNVSEVRTISTGTPQGCVLSPLLFSLYTNCCTSNHESVKLIKFADDTTVIGLISDGDESAYRMEVDRLVTWCNSNNLVLNAQKTVEMRVDFRKAAAPLLPLTLTGSPIPTVESYRFLGTTITQDLKWELNISSLIKKAQQRMFFLRQLRSLSMPAEMMEQFYTAIIESILTSSITVWYAGATTRDRDRLQRVVRSAEKVIGSSLPPIQDLHDSRTLRRAGRIRADPSHPGHGLFEPLPSGRRLRSIRTRTSRHRNSFFPSAVALLNSS